MSERLIPDIVTNVVVFVQPVVIVQVHIVKLSMAESLGGCRIVIAINKLYCFLDFFLASSKE